ncbi:ATP-grasp domain-containing protein [Paragemmobacter straminiformis]|uniref:ATP-grasp domain-containing protein n=1 Tax=Paragemmobacter straminiformis TaxID=2045119 RepID=A0A842I9M2_9RHOB|nr:ATP-grasp domain-containing protein [Gemmobacter straminiformis]MBC2836291.1 ATP-grasp domain-containing protein [Gemmobacter straminiformis]
MKTVLVTGTGAIIGYGVLRALRDVPNVRRIAADIFDHAVGKHFADDFVQAPLTSDPSYRAWLLDTVEQHNVDLIIPCIEQDVAWFAEAALSGPLPSVRVCLNDPLAIRLCADKATFDTFLSDIASPLRIPTLHDGSFADLVARLGLPFLLKPRRGYASKGIVKISSEVDFHRQQSRLGSDVIAQRIVGNDDEEFTVSAFCIKGNVSASIALRRRLAADGSTARASRVSAEPFTRAISDLAAKLNLNGPSNFQFRIANGQLFLLEINPRISSATSIRHAFGYNEAAMAVDYFLHGKSIDQPTLRSGSAIRYIEDVITYDTGTDF